VLFWHIQTCTILKILKYSKPMEEKHLQSSEFIKDIVIGVSDGLTVPFALAAGL
jgi:hypothetical protein